MRKRLREERRKRGLSAYAVAKKTGLTCNIILETENGRRNQTGRSKEALETFYGLPWSVLGVNTTDIVLPFNPNNFRTGELYTFERVSGFGKGDLEDGRVRSMRYIRTEGIHHIFAPREASCLECFTNVQLMDWNIQEGVHCNKQRELPEGSSHPKQRSLENG